MKLQPIASYTLPKSQIKAQSIQTSFMSIDNARELLDLVKGGFAKLGELISNFPIQSDALIAQFNFTDDIEACVKRKNALSTITDLSIAPPSGSSGHRSSSFQDRRGLHDRSIPFR
jgi:hypothetical protein